MDRVVRDEGVVGVWDPVQEGVEPRGIGVGLGGGVGPRGAVQDGAGEEEGAGVRIDADGDLGDDLDLPIAQVEDELRAGDGRGVQVEDRLGRGGVGAGLGVSWRWTQPV